MEQAERYDEVDSEAITSSAIVFCEMIEDAGYTPLRLSLPLHSLL